MSRASELALRRQNLLLRSAALRGELIEHTDELEHAFARIERGIGLVRNLSGRPMLLAGGAALLLTLGPRKAFRWLSRGLLVTSVVRRAFGLFQIARPYLRRGRDDPHQEHEQLFV